MAQPWQAALWTLLWTALLAGCAALEQAVQKPKVAFAGADLAQASLTSATVNFKLTVDNPNPVPLPVKALRYDLQLNRQKLFSGTATEGTNIPSRGQTTLTVPITVDFHQLANNLKELLQRDSVDYLLRGEVDLGMLRVPYEAAGQLPLPSLPDITLRDLQVASMGLSGLRFAVHLGVENNNNFPVRFDSLSYRVKLADEAVIQGFSEQGIAIEANGQQTVSLAFNVGLRELGQAVLALRSADSIPVAFDGDLGLPGMANQTLPLSWTGQVPIRR